MRVDAAVLEAMQRWANDDLRSLNGQIEYILRESLRKSGRLLRTHDPEGVAPAAPSSPPPPADESE